MNNLEKHRLHAAGYKVGFLSRTCNTLISRWLESYGMGPAQVGILTYVLERGSATQDEISQVQRTDRAATARALVALEKGGFIFRCENPDNRRKKLVFSSQRARQAADELFAVLTRLEEQLFSGFSSEEKTLALQLLDKMTKNAQAGLDGGAPSYEAE